MSILATYQKIQAMVSQTTSTITAPTAMPGALNDVDLPTVLCFPGPARWNSQAISYKRQQRPYTLRAYVKAVAQGQGIDEGWQQVMPVLQAVGNKFLSSSGLSLENTVDQIDNIKDGGVQVLMFAGVAYHGFEFTFDVVEKG